MHTSAYTRGRATATMLYPTSGSSELLEPTRFLGLQSYTRFLGLQSFTAHTRLLGHPHAPRFWGLRAYPPLGLPCIPAFLGSSELLHSLPSSWGLEIGGPLASCLTSLHVGGEMMPPGRFTWDNSDALHQRVPQQ